MISQSVLSFLRFILFHWERNIQQTIRIARNLLSYKSLNMITRFEKETTDFVVECI